LPFWYTAKGYSIASVSSAIGLIAMCVFGSATSAEELTSISENIAQEPSQALELPHASMLVEGDIFQKKSTGRRSIGVPDSGQLWVDGIVPYKIGSALAQHSIAAIENAISHWNQVSGITFMPVAEVIAAKGASKDSVLFKKKEGCASWVGRQGGQQEVWVGANCSTGSIMHEIGHVLGLEHEHTRPDRDQYITIHWASISADKSHNFDVARSSVKLLGKYDYGSIMHYGRYNFSQSGEPTITPLFGELNSIGQRAAPSQGDLNAVAELYAADISVVAHLYTNESGYEAAIHVDNNGSQGAHTIKVRVSIDTSSILAHSNNGWSCEKDFTAELVCTLDRLPGDASSILLLDVEPDEFLTAFEAVVSSKTPDIDLQNNSNRSGVDQVDIVAEPVVAAALPQDDDTTQMLGGAMSALWMLLTLLLFRRKH
jgi:hypothetical protein